MTPLVSTERHLRHGKTVARDRIDFDPYPGKC